MGSQYFYFGLSTYLSCQSREKSYVWDNYTEVAPEMSIYKEKTNKSLEGIKTPE